MIIKKSELKQLLVSSFDEGVFIEGNNPFLITWNNEAFNIYIKNITPTAFPNANENVVRIQLPKRDAFDSIKTSSFLFVFLGYDSANDVYTTWNPYWAKQRLNVTENVSFYSRKDAQIEARENASFVRRKLNNDGEVLCFPRTSLPVFLSDIKDYFPIETEYVAIGSKRRGDANELFHFFTNKSNIKLYVIFLVSKGYARNGAVRNYEYVMKFLFEKGLLQTYRRIFLKYEDKEGYRLAIKEFVTLPEIKIIEIKWHNAIHAALKQYVEYVFDAMHADKKEYESDECITEFVEDSSNTDWESLYMDNKGRLTKIANPKLLALLKPLLDTEYRNVPGAYNTIEEFYGTRFDKVMQIKDWSALFDKIDWENIEIKTEHSQVSGSEATYVETPELLFVNDVQPTIFYAGITIISSAHQKLFDWLGQHIEKGGGNKVPVKVKLEDEIYDLNFSNANVKGRTDDIIRILYPETSSFAKHLQKRMPDTYDFVKEYHTVHKRIPTIPSHLQHKMSISLLKDSLLIEIK